MAAELFEPDGMDAVRRKYAELSGVVDTFNEKVSDVLSRAEVQFLQAYRGHMQGVHREKLELEAKLRQAEGQQASDTQINALERDVAWYSAQKHRLESAAAAMQKDLLYLQERHHAVSTDRARLASKLKATMKDQRLGRSERLAAEAREAEAHEAAAAEAAEEAGRIAAARSLVGSLDMSGSVGSRASLPSSRGAVSDSFGQEALPRPPTNGGACGGGGGGGASKESLELRRALRAEKAALAADRAEVARLRSLVVTDKALRTDLEEFFLNATEDLRNQGLREERRKKAAAGGGSPAGGLPGGALLVDGRAEADLAALFDSLFPGT